MHFWLLINLTHVRVDKDADGRINEEEVKEVRVYHQIKNLRLLLFDVQ